MYFRLCTVLRVLNSMLELIYNICKVVQQASFLQVLLKTSLNSNLQIVVLDN